MSNKHHITLGFGVFLESSSIIPTLAIEEHLQCPCNILLIQILLKLLPLLYIKAPYKKQYLINLIQTYTDCSEIDKLLHPVEEKNREPDFTEVVRSNIPKKSQTKVRHHH